MYCNTWLQDWHKAQESCAAANSQRASHPPPLITSPSVGSHLCSPQSLGWPYFPSSRTSLSAPTLKALARTQLPPDPGLSLPALAVPAPEAGPAAQSLLETQPFSQAWWSGLTVSPRTPTSRTSFLLSLRISPVIPAVYLDCFLTGPLAKKSLQCSVIAMIIIIILRTNS